MRLAMTQLRNTAAPSGGGFTPVAFLFWTPELPRRRIELSAPVGEGRFGGYSNYGPRRERPV